MPCKFCNDKTHNVTKCQDIHLMNFSIFITHFVQLAIYGPKVIAKRSQLPYTNNISDYFLSICYLPCSSAYRSNKLKHKDDPSKINLPGGLLSSNFVKLLKCYMSNVHNIKVTDHLITQLHTLDLEYKYRLHATHMINKYTHNLKDFVDNLLTEDEVTIILDNLMRFNGQHNEIVNLKEDYIQMYKQVKQIYEMNSDIDYKQEFMIENSIDNFDKRDLRLEDGEFSCPICFQDNIDKNNKIMFVSSHIEDNAVYKHNYCSSCVKILLNEGNNVKCPISRNKISYVICNSEQVFNEFKQRYKLMNYIILYKSLEDTAEKLIPTNKQVYVFSSHFNTPNEPCYYVLPKMIVA